LTNIDPLQISHPNEKWNREMGMEIRVQLLPFPIGMESNSCRSEEGQRGECNETNRDERDDLSCRQAKCVTMVSLGTGHVLRTKSV